jgi:hypothetical protein
MIIGIGHTALHFTVKGKNPAAGPVIAQMKQLKIDIAGLGNQSLYSFHEGFSITMGMLLFFFGLQSFFLSKSLNSYNDNKIVFWIPVVTTAVLLFLSLRYFIIIPQTLSFIALVAYGMCLWKLGRQAANTQRKVPVVNV